MQTGDIRHLFRAVQRQSSSQPSAVLDTTTGLLTAAPAKVLAHAVAQWEAKLLPALTEAQAQQYCEAVEGVASPRPPPEGVDEAISASELMRAIRRAAGKASGPGQWGADLWVNVPPAAIDALCLICNRIVEVGRWPVTWTQQEVVLIGKPSGGFRPLGITPW